MYIDTYYIIFVLPAILLTIYAQARVHSTFNKYLKVRNLRGMTGAEAARIILQNQGIYDVTIERIPGNLTDHYDPRTKTLRLSGPVYDGTSIASVGVSAHEAGHAIQHNESYSFLKVRHSIFPVVSISSRMAIPLIMLGFVLSFSFLVELGIILFCAVVFFQIITLPVEFNASKRALVALEGQGILSDNEIRPARKVLSAAALTYVAAAAVAVANLLRLILLANGGRRRR